MSITSVYLNNSRKTGAEKDNLCNRGVVHPLKVRPQKTGTGFFTTGHTTDPLGCIITLFKIPRLRARIISGDNNSARSYVNGHVMAATDSHVAHGFDKSAVSRSQGWRLSFTDFIYLRAACSKMRRRTVSERSWIWVAKTLVRMY